MSEYHVRFHMDNDFEVYHFEGENIASDFVGPLSDCEAWIRLREGGRL